MAAYLTQKTICMASKAANVPKNTKSSSNSTMSKQASRLAGALFANAGLTRFAQAEDIPAVNFDSAPAIPESLTSGLTSVLPSSLPEVDTSGLTSFISDNPVAVAGGAFLLALPIGINALLNVANGPSGPKVTNPGKALEALESDERVILVDIRSKTEINAQGSPDLRSLKRRVLNCSFTNQVKGEFSIDPNFAEKFSKLAAVDEESIVILIDADGTESRAAAKELSRLEGAFAQIYFVEGGAESWVNSGAPWRKPGKLSLPSFNIKDLGKNIDTLAEDFKQAPTLTKATVAGGALVGAAVLLANEIELVIELVGLVALGQFFVKNIFAEEREKTMTEIKTLVNEKVAVAEAGDDLKKIATVLLEDAPAAAAAESAPPSSPEKEMTVAEEPASEVSELL